MSIIVMTRIMATTVLYRNAARSHLIIFMEMKLATGEGIPAKRAMMRATNMRFPGIAAVAAMPVDMQADTTKTSALQRC